MSAEAEDTVPFSKWIARPQSLIALSAVLLSVCGLFIAIYEAALTRREQRASVWPSVQVSASTTDEQVEIWVQNAGVGPARILAAALSHRGEPRKDWADLIRRSGMDSEGVSFYRSMIQGRVLPRDSDPETIFRVTDEDGAGDSASLKELRRELLEGRIDVTLCYCSVYDDCWTSSLQAVLQRSRDVDAPARDGTVDSCERAPRSAI